MDTGKTTTLIISLVVGVVLIAGVMTPILASAIGSTDSDSSDDEGGVQTFTNTGAHLKNFVDVIEEYDLQRDYDASTGVAVDKCIEFTFDESNVLHQVYCTNTWDRDILRTKEVHEDRTITQSAVLFMLATVSYVTPMYYAYDYDSNEIIYQHSIGDVTSDYRRDTGLGSIPISKYEPLSLTYEKDYDSDSGEERYFPTVYYPVYKNDTTEVNVDRTRNLTSETPAFVYSEDGDFVSRIGESPSLYYKDVLYFAGINKENAVGGMLCETDTEEMTEDIKVAYYRNVSGHWDPSPGTHSDMKVGKYVKNINTNPITITFQKNGSSQTVKQKCNIYVAPEEVIGELPPKTVSNTGIGMGSTLDIEDDGGNPSMAYYFGYWYEDGVSWSVHENDAEEDVHGTLESDAYIFISNRVCVYYDHTNGEIVTTWIDDGTVNTLTLKESEMNNNNAYYDLDVDFGCYINAKSDTLEDDFSLEIEEGIVGFFYYPDGNYRMISSPNTVLFNESDTVYFGSVDSGVVEYWSASGGLDSEMAIYDSDISSVGSATMSGVTEIAGYNSMSTTGNNGITVSVDGSSEKCNTYIVPAEVETRGGGGSGGNLSPTLTAMITVIPLIMTVGLVVGCIGYLKMKS